jgi:hypothetical protein
MHESNGHAAFSHTAGNSLDRVVTNVAYAEKAGQALERQIEISHPDCGETFCQGSDVLPPRELMQSLDTLFGSR